MRVVYVNSGQNSVHEPFDRYIDLTFRDMDIDYRFFDFAAHIKFFDDAFEHVRQEHDIGYTPDHLYRYAAAPLLQLVSEFEPDLVLTVQGYFLPPDVIHALRKTGALTALWVVDACGTGVTLSSASAYDYVFAAESSLVAAYRQSGCKNVAHLALAAYPGVFDGISAAHFESDVCFIGSGAEERAKFLDALADVATERGLRTRICGQGWDCAGASYKVKKLVSRKPVYAAEAAKCYAGAKVNITLRDTSSPAASGRDEEARLEYVSPGHGMFEIAASGGFQLVDSSVRDAAQYFKPGEDIDTFDSPEELILKIDYYLAHEDRRNEMAHRSRERCLKEHTYRNRLETIIETTLANDYQGIIRQVVASTDVISLRAPKKDRFVSQKIDRLIAHIVPSTAKRVLDIGCGEGQLGEILKAHGIKEICGVEADEAAAAKSRQRLDKVIVGDIEEVELPFRSGFFDCIIYRGTIENLREPWRVLGKQRKFLTANGMIIAFVPNTLYFPVVNDFLRGSWCYQGSGVESADRTRSLTLRETAQILRLAGYEIEGVEGVLNGRMDDERMSAFIRSMRSLDIAAESLGAEVRYAQYVVVAKKAKGNERQGVGLCLVKK